MGGGVDPLSASADDGDAGSGQFFGKLSSGGFSIGGSSARAHYADGSTKELGRVAGDEKRGSHARLFAHSFR